MMRPAVLAACRQALRDPRTEESQQHVVGCSFCATRVKAADSLAGFAARRPEMPAALRSEALLDSIYDRVTESAPQSAVSDWLEQASVPPPAGENSDWDVVGDGDQIDGDQLDGDQIDGDQQGGGREKAIGEFLRAPAQPDARVWSGVRRSILAEVAHEAGTTGARESASKVANLNLINWRVLLAGAAAAAVIGLINVSDPAPVDPQIVFADLDRAPDVPFATVRYGSRH